jgi:hypothetical protein
MNRYLPAMTACLLLTVLAPHARAQEIIHYYDPASKSESKTEEIRGVIDSEGPLGIKVRPRNAPAKEIAAADIRYIRYKYVMVSDLDYRKPFGLEDRALGQTRPEQRKKLLADALQCYKDLLPRAKEVPAANRFMQYRIARLLALQAEDDPDTLDAAIEAFTAFGKEHTAGWEIVPALKQLARLQEEKGNLTAAGQAYADLAAVPGITPRLRQESEILAARMLLRAGRAADAEKKLTSLDARLSAGDSTKPAVQVFLAQSRMERGDVTGVETQVNSALRNSADPAVQAAGHNVLGDLYLKKNKREDAFWQYLRVDVQYGDDPEEEAKALYYLAKLFDSVRNDKVRAQECLDRLQDKGQFGGTEYHKKAAAVKK